MPSPIPARAPNARLAGGPPVPPAIRWLRNHREIARFLMLKASAKQLRTIGEWIARPDFPAKQRKGFVGAEVEQWYLKFAAAEKERLAPLLAAKQIVEQKRVPGKRAMAELEGNIEAPAAPTPNQVAAGNPGPVPSQQGMAVELQVRYGLPIKRQTIQNWIHGIHLPPKAPRFPAPDPGRHGWNDPEPCYAWYEKFVVAPTRASGAELQGNLFERKLADAKMAELEEQIDKARKAKAEADALEREASETWILRDVARATATRAINDLLHIVESEYERNAPQRRREKLAALYSAPGLTPGTVLADFLAWDMADERERIDRLRRACAERAQEPVKDETEGNEENGESKP